MKISKDQSKAVIKVRKLLNKGIRTHECNGKPVLKYFSDRTGTFLLLDESGRWAGTASGAELCTSMGNDNMGPVALDVAEWLEVAGCITLSEYDEYKKWWVKSSRERNKASDIKQARELAACHGYVVVPK